MPEPASNTAVPVSAPPADGPGSPPPAKVHVTARQIGAVARRPGYLVGHLVVVVLAVATIWLGHWQWHAAHVHHGSLQNYAYAFQWWIFCGFGIAMWIRIMRDRAAREIEQGGPTPSPAERHAAVAGAAGSAPAGYRPYAMPTAADIDADDPADVVRTTYNAALAKRHSGDR